MRNGSLGVVGQLSLLRELEGDVAAAVAEVRDAGEPIEVTVSRSVRVALDEAGRVVVQMTSKHTLTSKASWVMDDGTSAPRG